MTIAEAIERRARMIRVHGSLEEAHDHAGVLGHSDNDDDPARMWTAWVCDSCWRDGVEVDASVAEDVALLDGVPVAMCPRCRAARREQPGTFEVETLEDLASDFMEAVERLIGGSP